MFDLCKMKCVTKKDARYELLHMLLFVNTRSNNKKMFSQVLILNSYLQIFFIFQKLNKCLKKTYICLALLPQIKILDKITMQ